MQNLHSDWKSLAACKSMDPAIFFPTDYDKVGIEKAKSICNVCPVKYQCREYAIQVRCEYGVFGGTTWKERVKIIRSRWRMAHAEVRN